MLLQALSTMMAMAPELTRYSNCTWEQRLLAFGTVHRTSVGLVSPVSSTVAVCPYLDMSETCPPRLSFLDALTGRQRPSGASSNPCSRRSWGVTWRFSRETVDLSPDLELVYVCSIPPVLEFSPFKACLPLKNVRSVYGREFENKRSPNWRMLSMFYLLGYPLAKSHSSP